VGKKKGYLTYEEINNHLPEDVTSAEQIDRILSLLNEMDIDRGGSGSQPLAGRTNR